MILVKVVYKLQSEFPKYETYALCDQIRRAVVSIPTNIAEGNARQYEKERRQFFYIALGSLAELDTLLETALRLGYIQTLQLPDLDVLGYCETISKMIHGLIRPNGVGSRESEVAGRA